MTKEQVEQGSKLVEKIKTLEEKLNNLKHNYDASNIENRIAHISFGIGAPAGGYITFSLPSRNASIRKKLYDLFVEEAEQELKDLKYELEIL